MSSTQPPYDGPPQDGAPPPGYPAGNPQGGQAGYPQAGYTYVQQPPRQGGRSVSFWVALFLGLLLLVSAILNVVLILFAAASGASALGGGSIDDEAGYRTVVVGHGEADRRKRVLRVPIVGAISEAASPLIGSQGGTVSQIRRALRLAGRDPDVKGLLLDINSPGGGVGDSDEIHRLIREFRKAHPQKKVLALFGDIAASGGYYIAMACDRVMARPTTITGSIGVIISSLNFAGLMKKHGVESVTIVSKRTPFKDMLSPTKLPSEADKAKIRLIVDEMLDRFIDIVDDGRDNLNRQQVEKLANGQIYSAGQALDNGLVDGVGDVQEALDQLFTMIKVDDAQVIEQRRLPTFADLLTGAGAKGPSLGGEALASLLFKTTGSKFLYFWPGGR